MDKFNLKNIDPKVIDAIKNYKLPEIESGSSLFERIANNPEMKRELEEMNKASEKKERREKIMIRATVLASVFGLVSVILSVISLVIAAAAAGGK